jgi:hypothetical protein
MVQALLPLPGVSSSVFQLLQWLACKQPDELRQQACNIHSAIPVARLMQQLKKKR